MVALKKIALVGVYGIGTDFTTGQAVKCYTLINWLKKEYGTDNIYIVNTYGWKKNPLKLFVFFLIGMINCRNIIIMPAQHGVKIFVPLVSRLNKIFHRSIHYIVIGGWLAEMLNEIPGLKKAAEYFDGIYVETVSMKRKLQKIGLKNVYYMPNSREYVARVTQKADWTLPLHVCTYSRVIKEKGIFDAIEICKRANTKLRKKVFHLDVYGKIGKEFQDEFDRSLRENEDIVTYNGCKNADETVETLSCYFALLFPTYYEGEGFAGTILDAFAAEIPIIANNWKYNEEIISDKKNGLIYPYRNLDIASQQLIELYKNKLLYQEIQKGCRESAIYYSTSRVMSEFIQNLK